jgi:excisionase family DNA binding protein
MGKNVKQFNLEDYCTVEEAAALLNVKEGTVRGQYIPRNMIKSRKIGSARMLLRSDIERLNNEREQARTNNKI